MNGACVAQLLAVIDKIQLTQVKQGQMLDCKRLFHCYMDHRWGTRCDVTRYHPNVQAPLFCYQVESSMRLGVVVPSVLEQARKQNRPAQQMAAWIIINKRGLRMRYAQDLEQRCRTGSILFTKGDLFQLIKTVGGFEQNSILWDSPHNLQ